MADEKPRLKLYHATPSRSSVAMWMLEEVGEPYEVEQLNLRAGDQLKPEYLAINPMGKVPTLVDGDVVITESAAIAIHRENMNAVSRSFRMTPHGIARPPMPRETVFPGFRPRPWPSSIGCTAATRPTAPLRAGRSGEDVRADGQIQLRRRTA